jgi:hypothetical protein
MPRGRPAALHPYDDHALVCSNGRGGQMGAWKQARHDGACNILVRLGKVVGLREGAGMDLEVPYLFTQRHQGEDPARRPGHSFRGQQRQQVRAPGRRTSADTAFKGVAYDAPSAATQTFNNGQYGHSIATRRPGSEAKPPSRARRSRYRAALADVQPLTNRRTKFEAVGGLRIVRVDGLHSAEAGQRVGAAGFATFLLQYCNIAILQYCRQ